MLRYTNDEATVDTLRDMILGHYELDELPTRRCFVDEDGNLRYSTYDANGSRHDYVIELYEVK